MRAIDADVLAIEEGAEPCRRARAVRRRPPGRRVRVLPRRQRRCSRSWACSTSPARSTSAQFAPHAQIVDLIEGLGRRRQRRRGARPLPLHAHAAGRGSRDRRAPAAADRRPHEVELHQPWAASLWEDPATRQSFIVAALVNRRRISAEGMRIRRYLDAPPRRRPRRRDHRARRPQRRPRPGLLRGALHDPQRHRHPRRLRVPPGARCSPTPSTTSPPPTATPPSSRTSSRRPR